MRILIIRPVPVEFTSCRSLLSLRDTAFLAGCRRAQLHQSWREAVITPARAAREVLP